MQTADGRQALLLPDLEGVDTVEQQVCITCRKGGIDPAARPVPALPLPGGAAPLSSGGLSALQAIPSAGVSCSMT